MRRDLHKLVFPNLQELAASKVAKRESEEIRVWGLFDKGQLQPLLDADPMPAANDKGSRVKKQKTAAEIDGQGQQALRQVPSKSADMESDEVFDEAASDAKRKALLAKFAAPAKRNEESDE